MSNFQNGFTRYFNTKHQRVGPLFLDQFKGVRIETEDQLVHVSRYIHLNPYTSFVVKDIEDIKTYPWSSLREYLKDSDDNLCKTNLVLSLFKSRKQYFQFIIDQKDYQRKLNKIKHLILEE